MHLSPGSAYHSCVCAGISVYLSALKQHTDAHMPVWIFRTAAIFCIMSASKPSYAWSDTGAPGRLQSGHRRNRQPAGLLKSLLGRPADRAPRARNCKAACMAWQPTRGNHAGGLIIDCARVSSPGGGAVQTN